MKRYWVSRRDNEHGPYATEELRVMTMTGEVQTSDQIRLSDQDGWQPVREVLRNKPSMLQREWAHQQSRQAGFGARCLMGSAVVAWAVPVLGKMAIFVSVACVSIALVLIAVQLRKGDHKAAVPNLIFAGAVTPLLCWVVAMLVRA